MRQLSRPKQYALLAVSLAVLAVLLFPVYWMVMTSIVPSRTLLTTAPPLVPAPSEVSFDAYTSVIEGRPILRWLGNSVLSTLGAAIISTVVSTLGGYSLSRFRSKGQQAMGVHSLV